MLIWRDICLNVTSIILHIKYLHINFLKYDQHILPMIKFFNFRKNINQFLKLYTYEYCGVIIQEEKVYVVMPDKLIIIIKEYLIFQTVKYYIFKNIIT